ncbi:hypothetical protein FRC01_006576 [Tulasnella sp. 417]|nr:hypothetical protein FRC01_006576 [Tulasnella sp. 417]
MDFKSAQSLDSSTYVSHDFESEPPTAGSSTLAENIALAPTLRWTTRPAKHRLLGLLPTAAVIVTTLGFVALILGVLLGYQCKETQRGRGIMPAIRDGYFYVVEGHNQSDDSRSHLWVLTISGVANQIISGATSVVIALVAYRVGAEWLRLSRCQSSSSAAETPTPAQYGLLVRVLGSASATSLAEAFVYTARSWNRSRLPRMFRRSIWLAAALWFLSRLVGLTDVWLHGVSFSLRSNVTLRGSLPGPGPMWGVSFNDSICDDMKTRWKQSVDISPAGFECLGPYEYFVYFEEWGHDIAFDVMTGSADAPFLVRMAAGDTAVVTPGPKVVDTNVENFMIPTIAAQASCTSLNDLCRRDLDRGTVNCTSAGYPNFPYLGENRRKLKPTERLENRVLGVVGQELVGLELGSFESAQYSSNPVKMAIQLQWEPLEQGLGAVARAKSESKAIASRHDSDMAIDESPRPTLYAGCNVTFFDAFAQWNSTKQDWNVVNSTQSSQDLAATLWLPAVWQYATEQLASNLMYTARRDSREDVMRALGQNLAELTLVAAAGFYRPDRAFNVSKTEKMLVSVYPVLPILTLLALLCSYAVLSSIIFLSAYRTPDAAISIPGAGYESEEEEIESSTLTLAQRWLTNPMPLAGFSFPSRDGLDGTRSVAYFAINSAQDTDEVGTRLAIGVNGERFGVIPWGERQYYVKET